MQTVEAQRKSEQTPEEEEKERLSSPLLSNTVTKKVLASPQMRKVRPLSPYMEKEGGGPV